MTGTTIYKTPEGEAAYRGLLALSCGALGSLGFVWGSFAVMLADLGQTLGLSPGPLGLALSGGMVASLPVMALAGRAADRMGRRPLLVVSAALMGVGFAWLAFVGSFASLFVALLLLSAASGAYDVAANTAAMDYERATGLKRMALIHAAFSAGGALGALVAALAFLSEAAMEHWSGFYLRNALALPALLGASGVAVYHASMAAGRLVSAGAIGRFGNRPTLRAAGLLSAGGMVLALATTEPALVVLGFLVVGLALSAVVPIALSVAGSMFPERAGGASSVVTALGYGGFLSGPILIGAAAEFLGLRLALGVVVLAGISIFALADRPYADQAATRNS